MGLVPKCLRITSIGLDAKSTLQEERVTFPVIGRIHQRPSGSQKSARGSAERPLNAAEAAETFKLVLVTSTNPFKMTGGSILKGSVVITGHSEGPGSLQKVSAQLKTGVQIMRDR